MHSARRTDRQLLTWVAVVLLVAACARAGAPSFGPDSSSPVNTARATAPASPSASIAYEQAEDARLHQQAEAALARWADAVKHAGGSDAFQPVGELYGQIGDWEMAVGDNNKPAVMAGLIEASTDMPGEMPPNGTVEWPDGSTLSVPLLSAAQALGAMQNVGQANGSCSTCTPVRVTASRLTTGTVQTSRGLAKVPIWAFSLQGSAVQITWVAVARQVVVVPPPWNPSDAPHGISVDAATVSADGRSLTVQFIGARDGADQPCGADYTAEAVESDLAVVVVVHGTGYTGPRPSSTYPIACDLVGYGRSAVVQLARPLGDRAVLEVKEGLPVPVTAP